MKNVNQTTTQTSLEGMWIDIDPTLISDKMVSYARNASINSNENPNFYQTEQSNTLCFTLPYKFIGSVILPDDTILIASTDNTNSELGIGDPRTCTYTRLVNNSCLNFNLDFPITGRAKTLINGDVVITFISGNNPVRRININQIPFIYELNDDNCKTKKFSNELNCDEILLFKKISPPCISPRKTNGGNLKNGVYSIVAAYSASNQRFSDYYSLTTPIFINSETTSGTITVDVSNLDREFDQYQLILIADVDGAKEARLVGNFYTSQNTVVISDFTGPIVPIPNLVITKNVYERAGIISGNSEYLMLADLTTKPPLVYQPQAFNIKTEYVVKQVPLDYYKTDGTDIGHYRDEQYAYFISWLYNTGDFSQEAHLAGRKATPRDRSKVVGPDVYETDKRYNTTNAPVSIQRWQIENTAQAMVPYNNQLVNNQRLLGHGEMGYWESTDLYPDNAEYFGEDACTPIRHHKFPDECKVPRFSVINGKTYINILGVQFSNIEYPKDINGNLVPNIIGYRIIRADRHGNRTVIARGMASNVRSYVDQQADTEILYANYPYNSLQVDPYLSSKQTVYKGKKETNYVGLSNHYKDKFNFYTPHGYFDLKYRMGTEWIFETEESAQVKGNFQPTDNHPKFKLLTQAAFWTAVTFALIETLYTATGQKGQTTTNTNGRIEGTALITGAAAGTINFGGITGPGGNTTTNSTSTSTTNSSALSIASGQVVQALSQLRSILSGQITGVTAILRALRSIIGLITAAGATAALFTVEALTLSNQVINIIRDFLSPINYAYQYNSHAFFNSQRCIPAGNKRRLAITQPLYLTDDNITIDDKIFNNFKKQQSIYVELNEEVDDPTIVDDSLRTISGFGSCASPQNNVNSTASMFYVTSKTKNPNQYGTLNSFKPVVTHSCPILVDPTTETIYTSPVIFGGDCIIAPFAVMTKQPMFSQDASNANFPDDIDYDYRLYRNIGYARYWLDSSAYDYSALLNRTVLNYSTFTRTTTAKFNLDCKFQDGGNVFRVDDSYFYTYVNGVIEFIAESDYNISYREKTTVPFYSSNSANLTQIFNSENLPKQEEFKLNPSYKNIQSTETPYKLPDFNPNNQLPLRLRNSLIYSLPSFQALQTVDNWQYFLPANFFTFEQADFGTLTGIHKIDQDRVIFLFDKSSPFISMARSELQVGAQTVTIGDGGLFAQRPRELQPTDVNYGASQSKYAFSSTQHGYFYPSQSNQKMFQFTGSLREISQNGLQYWSNKYMPIQLYSEFPTYPTTEENPINGVGYLLAFDSNLDTYYFTKRDFLPLTDDITYNVEKASFYKGNLPITLRDPLFFKDISWTISYNPKLNQGQGGYVSFHDWHPDWTIQLENHFLTVEDNHILKHNDNCTSYCVYDNTQFPYMVEYCSTTGQQVFTAASIEYILEGWQYRNNCRDKAHVINANMDNLIVYNTEQCSGKLNLLESTDEREQSQEYPIQKTTSIDILYTKTENKYRINQFSDITSDRQKNYHIWVTDESGYKQELNPSAINYQKPEEEQKDFRHYLNKFRFIKNIPGATKLLNKINNIKNTISFR